MDDLRFGITVRTVRIRRGWRQDDLSAMTHVSRAQIGRIEHGHADSVQLGTLRTVCAALEIRVDLVPRWRGGDLDRMLSSRHALLAESVVQALHRDSPDRLLEGLSVASVLDRHLGRHFGAEPRLPLRRVAFWRGGGGRGPAVRLPGARRPRVARSASFGGGT